MIATQYISKKFRIGVTLKCELHKGDWISILALKGLLDKHYCDSYRDSLMRSFQYHYIEPIKSNLIADLTQIDFIDSDGLGWLVQLAHTFKKENLLLTLIANKRVQNTIQIVRLSEYLNSFGTIKEASEVLKSCFEDNQQENPSKVYSREIQEIERLLSESFKEKKRFIR